MTLVGEAGKDDDMVDVILFRTDCVASMGGYDRDAFLCSLRFVLVVPGFVDDRQFILENRDTLLSVVHLHFFN